MGKLVLERRTKKDKVCLKRVEVVKILAVFTVMLYVERENEELIDSLPLEYYTYVHKHIYIFEQTMPLKKKKIKRLERGLA